MHGEGCLVRRQRRGQGGGSTCLPASCSASYLRESRCIVCNACALITALTGMSSLCATSRRMAAIVCSTQRGGDERVGGQLPRSCHILNISTPLQVDRNSTCSMHTVSFDGMPPVEVCLTTVFVWQTPLGAESRALGNVYHNIF